MPEPIVSVVSLLAASGVGAGIFGLVKLGLRQRRLEREAWRTAADAVGGAFALPGGPWYKRTPMTVRATLTGLPILADHYTVSSGKSSVTYTRVRGPAPGAGDLRLGIHREGALGALGRALGMQDAETGDASFDRAFVVKTSDEGLARAWLRPETRRAVELVERYQLQLKDGETRAICVGIERRPAVLVSVMQAVAALGAGGIELLAAWRRVAETVGGQVDAAAGAFEPDGKTTIRLERGPIPITIDAPRTVHGLLKRDTRVHTRVGGRQLAGEVERWRVLGPAATDAPGDPGDGLAWVPVEAPHLDASYRVFSTDPPRTAARLTAALVRRLGRTSPDLVEVTGERVTVLCGGVVTDPARLEAAVEVVAELAAPPTTGPYR